MVVIRSPRNDASYGFEGLGAEWIHDGAPKHEEIRNRNLRLMMQLYRMGRIHLWLPHKLGDQLGGESGGAA